MRQEDREAEREPRAHDAALASAASSLALLVALLALLEQRAEALERDRDEQAVGLGAERRRPRRAVRW